MPFLVARILALRHLPLPGGYWFEIWSALIAIVWATWTWWTDTHHGLSTQPNYRIATMIMESETWSMLGFGLGAMQMVACVYRVNRWWRVASAFLMSAFWGLLTYAIFLANNHLPSLPMLVGYSLGNVLAMFLLFRREQPI